MAPRCPTLKVVVTMDPLPPAERDVLTQWAEHVGLELLDMGELETWGATPEVHIEPGPIKGDLRDEEIDIGRILTISYTSGTTGQSSSHCH